MKLCLGCGDRRMDGYTNIDLREDVADIVADVAHLTFADAGTVEEIVAEDVLEHFPAARTQQVLAEWNRVLVAGGSLIVKVPNLHAIAEQLVGYDDMAAAGDGNAASVCRMLIRNIYGGHRWGPDGAYDTHHAGWTPTLLAAELAAAGFDVIDNDHELNMRVTAKKVA